MKAWLCALALVFGPAWAAQPPIPQRALELMPTVVESIDKYWPDLPLRSYIPAQIEQETCISLKHPKCWSSKAELRTSREYGFGLGQFTVAYNTDGSIRFNAWEEVKRLHPDLEKWQWEDRLNPILTIRAITIKNSVTWRRSLFPTSDPLNRLAFVASEYNGGSTKRDRILCESTKGCDATRWFHEGNKLAVEDVSTRSKVALPGYGKSFFEINREYVRNVLLIRNKKYVPFTG